MNKIHIKLANKHKDQIAKPEVRRELSDVQSFFEQNDFNFKNNTVNFVILKGLYSHIERSLRVVGVFVNKIKHEIYELRGTLRFSFKKYDQIQLPELEFNFPKSFLGSLDYNEGFIIHINVPVEGLKEDQKFFDARDMEGYIKNITIVKK